MRATHSRRVHEMHEVAALVGVLSVKNFHVRYKTAALGVAWAVLQPAFQAAVMSAVFVYVIKIERVPQYPLYVLSGMLPWAFFTQALSAATTSVVDNGSLVKKVALNRMVFPLSAIGGVAMAFACGLPLLVTGAFVGGHLGAHMLLLVPAILLSVLVVVAIGTLTCALQVGLRDVKYAVESLMTVTFYATPILYAVEHVPGRLQALYSCNPMTGVLALYRGAVMERPVPLQHVATSTAIGLTVLLVGLVTFRRRAADFADLV